MFYNRRRREISPEEKARNAAAREARKQAAMTCQVCGRPILANKGEIAHHGYTRPGEGWQTASCVGAKRLPFEVDRSALGEEIVLIERHLETIRETRGKVEAETVDVVRQYDETVNYRRVPRTITFNRGNFDEVVAGKREAFRFMGVPRFDELKRVYLQRLDYSIRQAEAYLVDQRSRFAGWKQTHDRRGDQWVAI